MRKIKFRAWDSRSKKIVYSSDKSQEYGWFTDNNGNMICVRLEENKDVKLNNIMEYTGCKDINSKEIYEGDIIKMIDGTNTEWIEQVTFKEGRFGTEEETLQESIYMWDGVEVIGNIYEDKQLLQPNK